MCATASTTETKKATSRSTRERASATCIWARRKTSHQGRTTFRSAVCRFTGRRSWLSWRTDMIKTTSQDSWETYWRWGCRSSSINYHKTETGRCCQQLLIQCQAHTSQMAKHLWLWISGSWQLLLAPTGRMARHQRDKKGVGGDCVIWLPKMILHIIDTNSVEKCQLNEWVKDFSEMKSISPRHTTPAMCKALLRVWMVFNCRV